MAEYPEIEEILAELREHPSVYEVTAVSRRGTFIAGDVPKGVHLDTYVAMSAILLGAAEAATAELKDTLRYVVVELNRTTMILSSAGMRALLVVTASKDVPAAELAAKIKDYGARVADRI